MKFEPRYVVPLLEGRKTLTIRLADEWSHLEPHDQEELVTDGGSEPFGVATIGAVITMSAMQSFPFVQRHDGHRSYPSRAAYLDDLRGYWPHVERSTQVASIEFLDVGTGPADPRVEGVQHLEGPP